MSEDPYKKCLQVAMDSESVVKSRMSENMIVTSLAADPETLPLRLKAAQDPKP